MSALNRGILSVAVCALVLAPALTAPAAQPGEALLHDDFDTKAPRPIDAEKWEVGHGKRPVCEHGRVLSAPNTTWTSRRKFAEPVSVEFSGVFVGRLPHGAHNQVGLAPAPGGHGPDMVVWTLAGDVKPKRLVPLRSVGGQAFWKEGFEHAVALPKLPDMTRRENAINLRIDWWPGKLARYYLNGKLMAQFTTDVPDVAVPVAVRDESVYFRIGDIKVTRITQPVEDVLQEAARARKKALQIKEEAARAREQSAWAEEEARADARIRAIAERYRGRGLRMVIACPGRRWGMDAQITDELKRAGVQVLAYPDAPDVRTNDHPVFKSTDATRYNLVIFGENFYARTQPDPNTGEMPKGIRDQIPPLRRFLQEGGGIWFSGLVTYDFGKTAHTLNYVLKELGLGAEVVGEVVKDKTDAATAYRFGRDTWFNAWVEILPDPLTKGLKGLWHPSGIISDEGSMGVIPIVKLGPEWRVLVRGMPTAASYGLDLKKSTLGHALLSAPGAVKSSPILCAVRQVGKGRVVLWPTWSNFTVVGGSGGMLLDAERDGRRSDGARLIENLLCWLAEPSQGSKTIGQLDPAKDKAPRPQYNVDEKLKKWTVPGRRNFAHQYKGLIGAHSNLSDGKSSPEEMIVAAKRAGYDFIAFTEDLTKMDEGKWKRLLAACDKANAAGGSVLVNARNKSWESQRKFSEPVSVEFSGVYLAELPKSTHNLLGLAPFGMGPDMVAWAFDGTLGGTKRLVPLRHVGKKSFWKGGYANAVKLSDLPDITKPENAVNLRIDWWPGEKVRYYLNGKRVAQFTTSVPSAAVPVGVRDEKAGFRMRSIKVTSLVRKDGRKGGVLLFDDFTKGKPFDTAKTWRVTKAGAPIIQAVIKFLAYPGLDFLDDAGNRGLTFGQRYWVKDEWWSKDKPGRIQYWFNFTYQVDSTPRRWFPRVIIRSKTNNKRPWNQGLWSFFGAYCYEAGKLMDDSFHEWPRLIGRHVFFMNTGIMAVHTVRNADEIAASAKDGLYQTYVRAGNLSGVLERIRGCIGGGDAYFASYISAGPEIQDFRVGAVWPGWEGIGVAIPGNDRALLHVLVRAEAGLKEVAVYDGERLVRRFLPQGKTLERFLTFHPDSYHAYMLTVTDRLGRRAVSWTAWMQVQENVHRRCGDNWNWMRTGKGAMTRKTPPKTRFSLLEMHHGWTSETLEEKRQRALKRPKYKCYQGYYGHGGLSAAVNGYMYPELLVDDDRWEAWRPVTTMDFATIGRFGFIVTNAIRHDYLVRKPSPTTTGCYSGPYKAVPSPWPADLKQYALNRRADGATINRYRGKVAFKREVSTPDGKPIRVRLGATDKPGAEILEVMNVDGASKRHKLGTGTVRGEIPKGGYICWYDDKGDGVGGIIALSSGVRYSYRKGYQQCYIHTPSPATPGTEVSWDVIYVTGTSETSNTNAQMEDVRVGMGIAGKPTLYEVDARVGKVVDQKFFLTLQADDHGFSGKIARTTGKLLPIPLPVMLKGLNPRWDAGIWYRGKTLLAFAHYYRDNWGRQSWNAVGSYDSRVDEIQYIPVIEGDTGYCQVDTDKQDADVFIGNLLVCDQPEVFITVVKAQKGKCTFEINNPTDKDLTVAVRPSSGFDLTGRWGRKLTLPAGSMQVVSIDAGK